MFSYYHRIIDSFCVCSVTNLGGCYYSFLETAYIGSMLGILLHVIIRQSM